MAVIYVVMIAFFIWAEVRILNKAGYSGWWALSMLVPLFGIIMFFVFAFSDWPVLQQLRAVSAGQGFGYGGPPTAPGAPPWGAVPWGAVPAPGAPTAPGAPPWVPNAAETLGSTNPLEPDKSPVLGSSIPAPGLPAPGWYPAEVQGKERYWDGVVWTTQVRPTQP